ncbi:hypothetical protein GGR92_001630 [Spirosoma lacussanchae]|uniref:AAA family ATPase n=1 Tax=Spirosoma lacussanchae TaxID=1884249 RepID=UPI001109F2EC|nr:AAA family ATPase [Spirosoma lacussanchae]
MNHFIDRLEITNFKSIRQLTVDGFGRINLFIGRPNVGKSNIIEALSLLNTSWEKLTDIVRVENLRELHFNGDINQEVSIKIRRDKNLQYEEVCKLIFLKSASETLVAARSINTFDPNDVHTNQKYAYTVNDNFSVHKPKGYSQIFEPETKRYAYRPDVKFLERRVSYLLPPFGENILYVLELMPELRKLYAQWFRQYGLRLVLDTASQSLKVQKEKGEDEVFQLPYSSVADTLQRIIFYKTAVASNENSVLLFEEPEAHAYPPYISEFTQEVIRSLTNQFFIVTHSPLIVEEFLTDAIDELGIFMVDFKDGQTVVRGLTTEEVYEVRKYGVDLFFNSEAYLS